MTVDLAALREGDELPVLHLQPSLGMIIRHCALQWTFPAFFYDPEAAKAAGMPGTIIPGPFKVGLSDPQASTAGLLALMALSDTDDNGEISEGEQETLLDLKRVVSLTTGTTAQIFDGHRASTGLTSRRFREMPVPCSRPCSVKTTRTDGCITAASNP